MMDQRIEEKLPLLDKKGRITKPGWATEANFLYNRKAIKAPFFRIKEWDYYAILDKKHSFAIAVTFSDLGYVALFSISFTDYITGKSTQVDSMKFLSRHKTGLSASSAEDSEETYADEKLSICFIKKGNHRELLFTAPNLELPNKEVGLKCRLTLTDSIKNDSIVIATPWKEKPTAFYLNQKSVGLPVSGTIRLGKKKLELEDGEALAVLDWGRGRWTYKNRWFWASATGYIDGKIVGFNFGYGFSDRSYATENAVFYDGKLHKIHNLSFDIKSHSLPWIMKDEDNRVDLVFTPIAPRTSFIHIGPILSDQKQYFGTYKGTIILDSGEKVIIDHMMGFAEEVLNKY